MEVLERYRSIVDDYDAFATACQRPLPTTVRVHRSTVAPDRVIEAFATADIEARPLPWNESILELDTDRPGRSFPAFLGWIHGQEAASCLPAPLLEIEPGDVVWDACAAPGSKTGHVVDLLEDRGLVFATDDNLGRLSALRFNTERLGATCVAVDHADARRVTLEPLGIDHVDAALVDVPCSCEGTVRKNPDAVANWSLDHVRSLAGVQRLILERAVQLTRPGGRVVYSTCTFAPEENEAVLDSVLDRHDCSIEPIDLPIDTRPGITAWNGERFDESVRHARRVYPHVSDTGGFFLAALRVGAS